MLFLFCEVHLFLRGVPKSWKCECCDLTTNLWLNLTDGDMSSHSDEDLFDGEEEEGLYVTPPDADKEEDEDDEELECIEHQLAQQKLAEGENY